MYSILTSGLISRQIPFALIQLPLYEYLKRAVQQEEASPVAAWQLALCGSVAGSVAAALTTPLDVAKTRIMLHQEVGMYAWLPSNPVVVASSCHVELTSIPRTPAMAWL